MVIVLALALHEDAVRPSHPQVELRLGAGDISRTHPVRYAFGVRPGGEHLFTRRRQHSADNHPVVSFLCCSWHLCSFQECDFCGMAILAMALERRGARATR